MKKSKIEKEPFYMANVQVVYLQKKLLKKLDYDAILDMSDWESISDYLKKFDYMIDVKNMTLDSINALYRSKLKEMREQVNSLSISNEYLDVFFLKTDILSDRELFSFSELDAVMLKGYNEFKEKQLHPLITKFCKRKIDIYFLQQCLVGEVKDVLNLEFCNGYLSADTVKHIASLPFDKAVLYLQNTDYHQVFPENASPDLIDVYLDNGLVELFKEYRYQVIGMEGILAYTYEKLIENFNLRLVLKAKLFQIPNTVIMERMRTING